MQPEIGPVHVSIFSGLEPEGDLYRSCRVSFLGNSPVIARLWTYVPDSRWVPVDTLHDAVVTERTGGMTIVGTSRVLTGEVGLAPSNAQTRWEVEFTGCKSCN